jgi:hypothetical protein
MTTSNTKTNTAAPTASGAAKSSPSKIFMLKQWAALKYAFSIERALIHLLMAALLFGMAIFIKSSHVVSGHNQIYGSLLLVGAGVQMFRACKHSLTPVALLLLVGLVGQYLLSCHIPVYLGKEYLQMITAAGLIGLVTCCFFRLK